MRAARALLAALALAGAGCAGRPPSGLATALNYVPDRPLTYAGLPLASGQIVLSEAPSALNLVIALLAEQYRPFVHAGILSIEEGEPYVYEAIGAWGVVLWRRPTDAIHGAVQRVPLAAFLDHNDYVEIYDPPPAVDRGRLVAFAQHHHLAETPFDAYFNAYDHRRLYCAEFVALGLEHAGAPPVPVTKARPNHSLEVALDWLGIHAERHYQAADLVVGAQKVAALSRDQTLTQARVHFAVRRETHRRYTENQRLGHVLVRSGLGLGLRPELEDFERAAQELYPPGGPTPTQAEADEAVRLLAERHFGVLPTGQVTPPSAEQLRPRLGPAAP